MAALIFKVGTLAVKTLAKPFGARFEYYIMNHPVARQKAVQMAQVGPAKPASPAQWRDAPAAHVLLFSPAVHAPDGGQDH